MLMSDICQTNIFCFGACRIFFSLETVVGDEANREILIAQVQVLLRRSERLVQISLKFHAVVISLPASLKQLSAYLVWRISLQLLIQLLSEDISSCLWRKWFNSKQCYVRIHRRKAMSCGICLFDSLCLNT